MNISKYILLSILTIITLTNCKSMTTKVIDLTDKNNFAEAAEIIKNEEEKAERKSSSKKIKKLNDSKNIFQDKVEEYYSIKIDKSNNLGYYRNTLNIIDEALILCPSSIKLQQKKAYQEKEISELDRMEKELTLLIKQNDFKEAINGFYLIKNKYLDSEKLLRIKNTLNEYLLNKIILTIDKHETDAENIEEINSELKFIMMDNNEYDDLVESFNIISSLINRNKTDIEYFTNDKWKIIYSTENNNLYSENEKKLAGLLKRIFEICASDSLSNILIESENKAEIINKVEDILIVTPSLNNSQELRATLAQSHMDRAEILINEGSSAYIGLIHIKRASELINGSSKQVDFLMNKCESIISSMKYEKIPVQLNINPLLINKEYIWSTYYNSFINKTKIKDAWDFTSNNNSININIINGKYSYLEYNKLKTRNSRYISGYNISTGSVKGSSEREIEKAAKNVDKKLDDYFEAESDYFHTKTNKNKRKKNDSYDSYQESVDEFYEVLDDNREKNREKFDEKRYKAVPVYIPYEFKEGELSIGYEIAIEVTVNGNKSFLNKKSIDSAFVRTGTKSNDIRIVNRNDIDYPYDMSVYRFLYHVNKVNNEIDRKIYYIIANYIYNSQVNEELTDQEKSLLSIILHPWGYETIEISNMSINDWYKKIVIDNQIIKYSDEKPVTKILYNKESDNTDNLKIISENINNSIVLIKNYSNSIVSSVGTGVLISNKGYILTCAHLLKSVDTKAALVNSIELKEYPVEIIYFNENNDIALIQAQGMNNSNWVNIRMKGKLSESGEVASIGVSINDKGIFTTDIAHGKVLKNYLENGNRQYLICENNHKTNSIGAPVISVETGEIVGIVQGIVHTGMDLAKDNIDQKNIIFAAPSNHFNEWLGLTYGDLY